MDLSRFRPTPEVIQEIKRRLLEAGCREEEIPLYWLEAIMAATFHWQCTSQSGLSSMMKILGFKEGRGNDDKEYEYTNPHTGESYPVKSSQVRFYHGASVKGYPLDPELIGSVRRAKGVCESCGVSAHCLIQVRDPQKDRIEKLCLYCLTSSESLKMTSEAQMYSCKGCNVKSCAHHPTKIWGNR